MSMRIRRRHWFLTISFAVMLIIGSIPVHFYWEWRSEQSIISMIETRDGHVVTLSLLDRSKIGKELAWSKTLVELPYLHRAWEVVIGPSCDNSDVELASKLRHVEFLIIASQTVNDESIDDLSLMNSLVMLDVELSGISAEGKIKLQKALPDTYVGEIIVD